MNLSDDKIYEKEVPSALTSRILPSWIKIPLNFSWNHCSMEVLSRAEQQLFSSRSLSYKTRFVPLRDADRQIWTIHVETDSSRTASFLPDCTGSRKINTATPLVLLHGLGGGIGLWVLNLNDLSMQRPIYALDLLGFGKSSRCHFSSNPNVAEIEWVESIEEWRVSMGIEVMYLLGHGLGGFLASSYALKYSKRVKRLLLVEPWGIAERPTNFDSDPRLLPFWVRAASAIVRPFNPLIALRAAGPWAPALIRHLRPDLREKFRSPSISSGIVYDYIYQCNARSPATGETAFCTLSDSFGWAINPIESRIGRLPISIPITVIHGARSWLDSGTGELIAQARASYLTAQGTISSSLPVDSWSQPAKFMSGRVDVHIVPQAGHHVYSDQATSFNDLINQILLEDDAASKL